MIYCPHHQLWYPSLKECLLCEREAFTENIAFIEALYHESEDDLEDIKVAIEI